MVIINAFISGILYLFYLLFDGWFWFIALGGFGFLAVLENKEIDSSFVEDERRLL